MKFLGKTIVLFYKTAVLIYTLFLQIDRNCLEKRYISYSKGLIIPDS